MRYLFVLILGLFCAFTEVIIAQEVKYNLSTDTLVNYHAGRRKIYTTTRVSVKPRIDGRLDDDCWQNTGYWDDDFVQQQPHQGKTPSQSTAFKVLYDSDHLYVGIICYDNEPEKISRLLGRRDDYTSGDIAGIALDTYFDKRTAFEFNVSAAGQKIDIVHLGAYDWDTNWDAVWEAKAHVGDSLWSVEMQIPFNQLRFSDDEQQVWGMHIWRWIDRLDEEDQWKLIPIDAPAMVYLFGELHGIKGIKKKRHLEFMPYVSGRHKLASNQLNQIGAGLDGKIGLASNLTLDFTVLPDFGQVEADPSVLNLTAYEVFFDEKRPFFLEGNSILDYSMGGDMVFYSRRIGRAPGYTPVIGEGQRLVMPTATPILNALKLTGKNKNGLSLGLINSLIPKTFASIEAEEGVSRVAVEPFTNNFVGRIKQDINGGNTVAGAMVTSSIRTISEGHLDILPEKSVVGAFDFQHNWQSRKYFIDMKSFFSRLSGSDTSISRLQLSPRHLFQRTDASHLTYRSGSEALSGWGGQVRSGKQSGKFRYSGTIAWRSPGADLNELGYQRDADLVSGRASLRYQVNQPKGIVRNYYFTLDQRHERTFGWEAVNDNLNLHGYLKFKNLWNVHLDFTRNFRKTDTRQLRGGPSLFIDPSASGEVFVQTNSTNTLFGAAGIFKRWDDNSDGGLTHYTFYLQWKMNNRLIFTSRTRFEVQTDNNQFVAQRPLPDGIRYVVGKIDRKTLYSTFRAEWFVTPELSFQYYGNPYASVGKYQELYKVADPRSKWIHSRYSPLRQLSVSGGKVFLDENRDANSDFWVWKPDFVFNELRSNFVMRWEYKAGSVLYFVWTHNRSNYLNEDPRGIGKAFSNFANMKSENVFMVKFSYWLSL